jgi:hypothetical protein
VALLHTSDPSSQSANYFCPHLFNDMVATVNIERIFCNQPNMGGWCYFEHNNETMSLGMPWEKEYGYSQVVKVRDTRYVSAYQHR